MFLSRLDLWLGKTILRLIGVPGSLQDKMGICDEVEAILYGPDGKVKMRTVTHDLVTDVGDTYCAGKVAGESPTAAAGMKLGTAITAAAKSGAGSFITTGDYISGSAQAWDATYPKSGAGAEDNVTIFMVTFAAGEGTSTTINEVAICSNTTDAGEADATGTYARSVFANTIPKGADDTLAVTAKWTHLGA